MGYERMKEILANPSHPEYEDLAEWVGLEPDERYDPTDMIFIADEFNEMLNDEQLSE